MPEQYPPQPPYGQPPQQPPYGQPPQQPPYGAYAVPSVPPPPGGYADWGQRAVAFLWDVVYQLPALVLMLIGFALVIAGARQADAQGGDEAGATLALIGVGVIVLGLVLGLVLVIRNLILRQGRTGYTWGKAKVGIRVVREQDLQPAGVGSALGRWVLHQLINQACYLDYLWPLWDEKNQTLTDKILSTIVINQPPPGR